MRVCANKRIRVRNKRIRASCIVYAHTLTIWIEDSPKRDRFKHHIKANEQAVESHQIAPTIRYPTGQIYQFLHSQLIDSVNAHVHVLTSFSPEQNVLLTSADVAALYPSINIEDGGSTFRDTSTSEGGNDHINRQQTGLDREIRVTNRSQYHGGYNLKGVTNRGIRRQVFFILITEDTLQAGKVANYIK